MNVITMRTITIKETFCLCGKLGINNGPHSKIFLPGDSNICIAVEKPALSIEMVSLTRIMMQSAVESSQNEILFFMKDWGFWGEDFDGIGLKTLQAIRLTLGEKRPLLESPGHLFHSTESIELHVCLLQVIMCDWDCYLIPSSARWIIDVNHDEGIHCFTDSQVTANYLLRQLKPWNAAISQSERDGGGNRSRAGQQ